MRNNLQQSDNCVVFVVYKMHGPTAKIICQEISFQFVRSVTLGRFYSCIAFNSSLAGVHWCPLCEASFRKDVWACFFFASQQPSHRSANSTNGAELMCQNKSAHNEQQMVLIILLFA